MITTDLLFASVDVMYFSKAKTSLGSSSCAPSFSPNNVSTCNSLNIKTQGAFLIAGRERDREMVRMKL